MKKVNILVILVSCLLLIVGCSKKKEEAAQLEQEVLQGQEGTVTDSALIDSSEIVDSAAMAADASAIPEEEVAPDMPRRPAGDGYTVQVAGCESEDYARHLVDLYTERGYEPYVSEFSYDGQVYYRVRIGLYESFGPAKQLQVELSDKYSVDGWIDKVTREF